MIKVTDLRGMEYVINAELIEKVENNPDTQLVLVNGHRYYIRETLDEVVERVKEYRSACMAARQTLLDAQEE